MSPRRHGARDGALRHTNPVMGDNTMGIHPSSISAPPWAVLGYRADGRPIYPIAGGAETDDEPDTDVEVEIDEAADEPEDEEPEPKGDQPKVKPTARKTDTEPDAEYVPPSREEWERVRRTLAKRKQEKLDVQKQLNELRDKHREQETDTERAIREAEEKAEAKYKPIVVRKAARAALIQAGATTAVEGDKDKTEARLSRLLKLIDVSDVIVDEDGEVLGLDEQVEALRADYPELFEAPARRAKAKPTGAPKQPSPDRRLTTAERHAARILGRS